MGCITDSEINQHWLCIPQELAQAHAHLENQTKPNQTKTTFEKRGHSGYLVRKFNTTIA